MTVRITLATVAALLATSGGVAVGQSARDASGADFPGVAGTAEAFAASAPSPVPTVGPCGAATPEVVGRTVGLAAERVYQGEVSSPETHKDESQVEHYAPLLTAVASGNRAAITAAVTSLVYSGTHIVRLRVTQGSTVLSDVGGPYILAPIGGTLRYQGRPIAKYLLSVQDDLGYVKLYTRFVGNRLVLYRGALAVPIEGVLKPAPRNIPDLGEVHYEHSRYEAFSFTGSSFPSGPLRISIFLEVPGFLTTRTCSQVKAFEVLQVAERTAHRIGVLSPSRIGVFVSLARSLTDAEIYIREGSRQLAGPSDGPAELPRGGSVTSNGRTFEVVSFSHAGQHGPLRVYALVPRLMSAAT